MNLATFAQQHNLEALHAYAETAIWFRPVSEIKTVQWQLIYTRLKMQCGVEKANTAMSELKDQMINLYLLGDIQDCPLLNFKLNLIPRSIDSLVESLNQFNHNERIMVLFSVSEGLSLQESTLLKWSELHKRSISTFGRELLENTIRHFNFGYCFWQYGRHNRPLPLIGFETRFKEVVEMEFEDFAEQVQSHVIANKSDVERFTQHIANLRQK